MKNWLTLVCVLGSLCGGVFTAYSAVSVGSTGLRSMASSLQSISRVMKAYHRNLNRARNRVMPAIDRLSTYVNTTYIALNNTYGESQPDMQNMMYNLEWFSQQFYYADQMVSSQIGMDLSQLNMQLQQTIDQLMQNYNMLVSSFSHQENGEACSEQFAAEASSMPDQLAKFGQCLKMEVDTVLTVVPPLMDIFKLVQRDLRSLNRQLKICAATSTNCVNEYFMDVQSELMNVNMELYMAQNLLTNYQHDAMMRNQLCGELIASNVQDLTQNLQMEFSQCMYPQTMMG